jgi:hypothetical protein
MVELVEKYAGFPLDAVDASVFAVAERLGADAIATLDRRHFSVVKRPSPSPSCRSPADVHRSARGLAGSWAGVLSVLRSDDQVAVRWVRLWA